MKMLEYTSGSVVASEEAAFARHRTLDAAAAKDMKDYLGRGRAHAGLSRAELQNLFVSIFRALARSSSYDSILTWMHDVEAEYRLRDIDPPFGLVRDEAEQFIKKVSDAVNQSDAG